MFRESIITLIDYSFFHGFYGMKSGSAPDPKDSRGLF